MLTEIISDSINCDLMDCKNIASIIESLTELTPLQKAFQKFCIEKSIPNNSDYNDRLIIESMKYPHSDESCFDLCPPVYFIDYCDASLKQYIIHELIKDFNFKYFNAVLLHSVFEDFDCPEDKPDLLEEENDGYSLYDDEINNEVIIRSQILRIILYCFNGNFNKFKTFFDDCIKSNEVSFNNNITKDDYERIFQRSINYYILVTQDNYDNAFNNNIDDQFNDIRPWDEYEY